MIESHLPGLSVGQQCALPSVSRSSFYYEPKGESEMNLSLTRVMDRQFLETPFDGVRQMTWHLRNQGHLVNEKRIRRLVRRRQVDRVLQQEAPTFRPWRKNTAMIYRQKIETTDPDLQVQRAT